MKNCRWPQQDIFAARVKEFCKKKGLLTARGAVDVSALSERFSLTEDTIRQFLTNSTRRRPHINTLSKIASIIGVSVLEFIDAPDQPVPSLSRKKWADLSGPERAIATALIEDITTDELSVAEKEGLYKAFRMLKDIFIQIKKKPRRS